MKMNARGKPLTDFEKFKAWLIQHCGDALSTEHQQKLDNDWLEFFWRHSPSSEERIGNKNHPAYDRAEHVSSVFFRTVLFLAVNHHARNNSKTIQSQMESWVGEGGQARLLESRHEWERLFDETTLETVLEHISSILDKLQMLPLENRTLSIPALDFFKDAPAAFLSQPTDQESALTLGAGLWLHALALFSLTFDTPDSPEAREWLRIVRNLLEYTTPSAENYARIIRGLNALAKHMGNEPKKLSHFTEAEIDANKIPGLDRGQLKEEVRKAVLRHDPSTGGRWLLALNAAEDHDLFRGQIDFLLGKETTGIIEFEKRRALFADWFPRIIGEKPDEIDFIRAALARSAPIQLESQQRLELPHTPDMWRARFQRNANSIYSVFRAGCFAVVDEAARSGNGTITGPSIAAPDAEHWMKDFIHHGRTLWFESDEGKIQNYYGQGTFLFAKTNAKEDGDILLGPIAALRNTLIRSILEAETHGKPSWRFLKDDADWRKITCASGPTFYRGHKITLRRDSAKPASIAEYVFGYGELTVSLPHAKGSPSATIPYPDDMHLRTFAGSINETAANLSAADPLRNALHELVRYASA